MALTLQEQFEAVQQQLEAKFKPEGEKLAELDSDTLLERHAELKAERLAMPDTRPAQERASVTNKVKRIEGVLRERGVDFVPLPQANRPMPVEEMTDDQLLGEFARIQQDYDTASPGQKSSMTVTLKKMKIEVGRRLEQLSIAPATDTVQPDPEAEGPMDAELVEVEATTATATATEEAPKPSRRRR
jgi:hypothetical protein